VCGNLLITRKLCRRSEERVLIENVVRCRYCKTEQYVFFSVAVQEANLDKNKEYAITFVPADLDMPELIEKTRLGAIKYIKELPTYITRSCNCHERKKIEKKRGLIGRLRARLALENPQHVSH